MCAESCGGRVGMCVYRVVWWACEYGCVQSRVVGV